jgi:hypothetical protein
MDASSILSISALRITLRPTQHSGKAPASNLKQRYPMAHLTLVASLPFPRYVLLLSPQNTKLQYRGSSVEEETRPGMVRKSRFYIGKERIRQVSLLLEQHILNLSA